MATKKGKTPKASTPKSTTSKGANSNPARLTRARVAINAIKAQLTKGSTVVDHSVRSTLKHPAQPKGVVVACFARQDFVVALLPTLGVKLKVPVVPGFSPDRNGTPVLKLEGSNLKAEATALGKRIAIALK